MGRTNDRISQSKRVWAGSLAIVDYLRATSGANLHPPGVWFADVMSSFSGVTFVLFLFLFRFGFGFRLMLSLKPPPFVQSFFDMHAPRQPHTVPNNCLRPFLFCFFEI